jgi:hypothetical protein
MTTDDIGQTLATILAGAAGHDEAYWLDRIGPVEKRPSIENIHSNWRLTPRAKGADLTAIASAVEIVRLHHPYVD